MWLKVAKRDIKKTVLQELCYSQLTPLAYKKVVNGSTIDLQIPSLAILGSRPNDRTNEAMEYPHIEMGELD
jgi:hypothetical protein